MNDSREDSPDRKRNAANNYDFIDIESDQHEESQNSKLSNNNQASNRAQNESETKSFENSERAPLIPQLEESKEVDHNPSKLPVVFVLGPIGSGKTSFCQVLGGEKAFSKFRKSTGTSQPSSVINQQEVTWPEDETTKFLLIDTDGFGESTRKDFKLMEELRSYIFNLKYVTQFLLVLNSQETRIDQRIQEFIRNIATIFGIDMFEHTSIVLTRWDSSEKAEALRKRQDVSKDVKEKELNKKIRELTGYSSEKQIPVFYVDSLAYGSENQGEDSLYSKQEREMLFKEIKSLKSQCFKEPKYEHKSELQEQILKPKKAQIKSHSEDIYVIMKDKRKKFVDPVEVYFDSRDFDKTPSLCNDIWTILNNYEREKGWLNFQEEYKVQLKNEIASQIEEKVNENLKAILEETEQDFITEFEKLTGQFEESKVGGSDTYFNRNLLLTAGGVATFLATGAYYFGMTSFPIIGVAGFCCVYYQQVNNWNKDEVKRALTIEMTQELAYKQHFKKKIIDKVDLRLNQLLDELLRNPGKEIIDVLAVD